MKLTPHYIVNISFLKHQGSDNWPISSLDYGTIYIGINNRGLVYLNIRFSRCTFSENFANTAACLYATVYQFADNTSLLHWTVYCNKEF